MDLYIQTCQLNHIKVLIIIVGIIIVLLQYISICRIDPSSINIKLTLNLRFNLSFPNSKNS